MAGDLTEIRENPSGSNTLLATYAFDDRGRRTSLTRGNGAVTSYSYDNVDRLTQIAHDLTGSTYDLTLGDSYSPANEVVSHTGSNDAYAYTGHANANVAGTANGLNQLTSVGGTSNSHDARGNITAIGGSSYGYSSENLLTSAPSSTTLAYDPLNRLYQTAGGGTTTRFGYDGGQAIAEYDGSSTLQRRYVFGPGTDEPLVWYEGTGTSTRRYFHADERGSVVAVSDASGNLVGSTPNRYDEYGVPQGTLTGRFGYTGQMWLPEASLYHYRARAYNPAMGRFMQTDPIGYGDGMNFYAYVGNDPINSSDPTGTEQICSTPTGTHIPRCVWVDGNGNGNAHEHDMTFAEAATFGSAFAGFIQGYGNGRDLSGFALPVNGDNTQHETTMLSVTSQFIGYYASIVNNAQFRNSWNQISGIEAFHDFHRLKGGTELSPLVYTPSHTVYTIRFYGGYGRGVSRSMYESPSDLARAMLHEPWHYLYPEDGDPAYASHHEWIDWWARRAMRNGFGRCRPAGGFPGC